MQYSVNSDNYFVKSHADSEEGRGSLVAHHRSVFCFFVFCKPRLELNHRIVHFSSAYLSQKVFFWKVFLLSKQYSLLEFGLDTE